MTGLSPALSSACKMVGAAMAAAPMAAVDLMNDLRETLEYICELVMVHLPSVWKLPGKAYRAIFVPNIDIRNNTRALLPLLLHKRSRLYARTPDPCRILHFFLPGTPGSDDGAARARHP